MKHQDILSTSAAILNDRGAAYGNEDFMFSTAAQIATLLTGQQFNKYLITSVLEAVKLARRRVNPLLDDNYIDGVNYMAFSGQFAKEAFTAPNGVYDSEDDIAAMAQRLAPIKKDTSNAQNLSVNFDGISTTAVITGHGK